MGNRLRQHDNVEQWRRRFREYGCPVDEAPPDSDGGLTIRPAERTHFDCLAWVHGAGVVRYVLRLCLISDDANRIIRAYFMESEVEAIRVLEPHETVPERFVSWGRDEDILNDRVNQPFGPARFREGLLLGEGLRTPVISGRMPVAPVTVTVLDQFDRSYSQRLYVHVHGSENAIVQPPKGRIGGGAFEPLDEDEQETSRREPLQRTPPAVHERAGSVGPQARTAHQSSDKSRAGE